MGTEGKRQHEKNNSTAWGNKPENSGERREIKDLSTKTKQYRQNRTFQNNEKKILPRTRRTWHKNIPTTSRQSNRTILDENMTTEKAQRKDWMDNKYERTRRTIRKPGCGNTYRTTKKTLKLISNLKTPGHDGIHEFWFKKFTSIHDRLALEMNRYLQEAQVPDWMTKGKTILIQKDPWKGTAPKNNRP